MKKKVILTLSILSLIITFLLMSSLNIYHFGNIINIFTLLYLVSMFLIIEYFLITIFYVITMRLKKEKILFKRIIGLIMLFISLFMLLIFTVILNIDWLNWYQYSMPFYINVIIRIIEYLMPSLILGLISIILLKNIN